tara:strand:+ start:51 stop:227 length:177 start_codon:yes stop_codon:yes gene_type:complete
MKRDELSESIQDDIITYMDNFKGSTYVVDDNMIDSLCQIVVDNIQIQEKYSILVYDRK